MGTGYCIHDEICFSEYLNNMQHNNLSCSRSLIISVNQIITTHKFPLKIYKVVVPNRLYKLTANYIREFAQVQRPLQPHQPLDILHSHKTVNRSTYNRIRIHYLVSMTLSGSERSSVALVSVVLRPWLLRRLISSPMPRRASSSTIGTVTPTMIAVLSLSALACNRERLTIK